MGQTHKLDTECHAMQILRGNKNNYIRQVSDMRHKHVSASRGLLFSFHNFARNDFTYFEVFNTSYLSKSSTQGLFDGSPPHRTHIPNVI